MAWIPLYLLEKDVEFLNDWLNQEEEIAFLVSNGHKQWIAREDRDIISDIKDGKKFSWPDHAEYQLWHIPTGPLPLLEANKGGEKIRFKEQDWKEDGTVDNPWLGWTEIRTGANSYIPYFGAGHPGVIHLKINLSQSEEIKISSFGWIGNHYKIIGKAADESTEKFWKILRSMVKKIGTQIPRTNDPNGKKEIFAFPTAYSEIKNGRPCSLNP